MPGRSRPIPEALATCRELVQQGIAAADRGQHAEAEALLAEAVSACPVDPDARRHYGELLWRRGERTQAVEQLEEAVRLAAGEAGLRIRLAEMYLALGDIGRARDLAEQALDMNPKLAAAWAIRGRVMRASGRLRQALADFHRALGYAPADQQILLEVAELYRQFDQPQRALATLHTLADTYSPGEETQELLYLTGLAYLALDRYEDAVESLRRAATVKQPTPDIFCRLGEAELLAGRPRAAAAAATRALQLMPQHQPTRNLLARLQSVRPSEAVLQR